MDLYNILGTYKVLITSIFSRYSEIILSYSMQISTRDKGNNKYHIDKCNILRKAK
jgi:hypothetical protein